MELLCFGIVPIILTKPFRKERCCLDSSILFGKVLWGWLSQFRNKVIPQPPPWLNLWRKPELDLLPLELDFLYVSNQQPAQQSAPCLLHFLWVLPSLWVPRARIYYKLNGPFDEKQRLLRFITFAFCLKQTVVVPQCHPALRVARPLAAPRIKRRFTKTHLCSTSARCFLLSVAYIMGKENWGFPSYFPIMTFMPIAYKFCTVKYTSSI